MDSLGLYCGLKQRQQMKIIEEPAGTDELARH
jgi:hypothetical protein